MQRTLVLRYRRFGTIFSSHIHLTPDEGTYKMSRNVGNYQSTLCNIPEGRRSHIHGGRAWNQSL